jgi:Protein of unknown function (DUF3305)
LSAIPLVRIPVGVVVERRKAESAWLDFVWQPVNVLAGEPSAAPWTLLSSQDENALFYAGNAMVELHRTETGSYRDNLNSGNPCLWVVMRATGGQPPYAVLVVTADPMEGEGLTAAGDDIVEAVPMPETIRQVVEAFVTEHHVEHPFLKRKRDQAEPEVVSPGEGVDE